MIAPELVFEVKRMLDAGQLSQRKIAWLTGVSRATVGAIASGARAEHQPRPRDDECESPAGPLARCPTCGGRVFMPCRLCRIRAVKRRELQRKMHLARIIGGNCRLR